MGPLPHYGLFYHRVSFKTYPDFTHTFYSWEFGNETSILWFIENVYKYFNIITFAVSIVRYFPFASDH